MRLHNWMFGSASFVTFILIGTPDCSSWLRLLGVVAVGATLRHAANVDWREREERRRMARRRHARTQWTWNEEAPNGRLDDRDDRGHV